MNRKKIQRCLCGVLSCMLAVSYPMTGNAEESKHEKPKSEKVETEIPESVDTELRLMDYCTDKTSAYTYNEGGNTLHDMFGVSYNSVLGWLGQHVNDNYYLGTMHSVVAPNDGDNRNPAGDCGGANGTSDIPGAAVLNCTGFVWHVLYKASGLDHDTALNVIPSLEGIGAGRWANYIVDQNIEYRTYYSTNNTAEEFDQFVWDIINDGYIEPGDVIWLWDASTGMNSQGVAASSGPNHHTGIYIGDYFDGQEHAYPWVDEDSKNRWWHSFGSNAYTGEVWNMNLTSKLSPGAICNAITVIKLGDSGTWMKNENGWWWQEEDGSYPLNQWKQIRGKWYWFDSRGYMKTGWNFINGKWYYLSGSGAMQTGWVWDGAWYYLNANGAMQTGWILVDGSWYYMAENGKMQTYWIQLNDKWYYLSGNGAMRTGWVWDGAWYHMDGTGAMETGWILVNGLWYYMSETGEMQTYWIALDDKWYYLSGNGAMKTGWLRDGSSWYYLDQNGVMCQDGWYWVDGKAYYLDESGVMASDTWIGDAYVDKSGAWVPDL